MGHFIDRMILEQELRELVKYLHTRELSNLEIASLLHHFIQENNSRLIIEAATKNIDEIKKRINK